jgi:hypothetical protein
MVDARKAAMNARNTTGITSGILHKTSVEATRNAHTTISHVGQKRTFDEYHGELDKTRNHALADVTNKTEFRCPTLHRCLDPLKASEIHNLQQRSPTEYSQRRHLALTPAPSSNPHLSLSHPAYGLPSQIVC